MNLAPSRQVGGVGFPSLPALWVTGSQPVTQAHSCCGGVLKGTTRLCRQDSCCRDVSFLFPCPRGIPGKHQIPLLSWLRPLKPEGIEMQTRRFSCRSADRWAFQPPKSSFHDAVGIIKPCCRWPMWASGWIRTEPGYWEGRRVSPLLGVTLLKGSGDPRPLGGQVSSLWLRWGLCASVPVCWRGSSGLQPAVKQLDGLFSERSASPSQKTQVPQSCCKESNVLLEEGLGSYWTVSIVG